MAPSFNRCKEEYLPDVLRERAKAYRALGKPDLAAADEKSAAGLEKERKGE